MRLSILPDAKILPFSAEEINEPLEWVVHVGAYHIELMNACQVPMVRRIASHRSLQPFDRVTLKDTGAFYESITIDASNNVMTIKASVNYTSFLLNRYGRDVFGIQRVKFNEFLEKYFVPIFKDSVNKITAR